ncbi:hypothetical protein KFK09_007403 [Dendrobium nobile]|uniref:thioredoxin-disulfide reductase (NADPH) n=1 Tax=Dendrobium nobile TaxID=94219 RepID=A0A8T3BU00_DENNO|nr:hypothetical protein KFK09_007403 [Dendrobium nobile]
MVALRLGMAAVSAAAPPPSSSLIGIRSRTLCLHPFPRRSFPGGGRSHLCPLNVSSNDEASFKGVENVVIIGSGPAGYTAAIYAARANLKPLVFEGFQVGGVPGGQLMTTTEVENFPGFPDGISGPDLMDRMRKQAVRWGAELFQEDVEFVDVRSRPFSIKSSEREVRCHSIIVATGATAKRLRLPREDEFWSRGISACAICDGASPLFKGQVLAVVGGGDTATEEALYLTKYARHVHLLVRKNQLRASKAMQDRVLNSPNITLHFNTEAVDVVSNSKGQMSGVLLRRFDTGEESVLDAKGLFYGIGHSPNSHILEGQVELDSSGYIFVKDGTSKTSVEGVFAAGDVQPVTEEVKKEPTEKDVEWHFDVTLTKHKGQVIDEFDQDVHYVEIDIEEDPEIAEAAGIMGTPCVQFFKNKEMIRTVPGVKMKKEYKEFIEANK